MATIISRLQAVHTRIRAALRAAGRDSDTVRLVAVSKTFPADAIREAYAGGQRDFGENYLQEALAKMKALADLPLVWHFIGPIQSNKTRAIAENFTWAHSVDRPRIAERLAQARPPASGPLQVCIQVNVSGEQSKSGVTRDEAPRLARFIGALPQLRLRGLMAIPEPAPDAALQRARFAGLRTLRDELNAEGLQLDTLSMGMSDDLEAAIAEGATMVRVGTAIFGERTARA